MNPRPSSKTEAAPANPTDGGRRERLRRFSARSFALVLMAGIGMIAASAPALAQACDATDIDADFNGDGKADLAIADPDATVSGKARAGQIHIAYDYGHDETQTITQVGMPGNDNAAGDRFGHAMDVVDWNEDGCSDLFVGVPNEDWSNNTLVDTGVVVLIPGSPAGLVPTEAEVWSQHSLNGGLNVDASETSDQFGYDLAAGTDAAKKPFLVIGMPGEDGTVANGGQVVYVRGNAAVDFNQNSGAISDDFQAGDLFGYAVTASSLGFAISAPGETVGTAAYSGMVHLFSHNAGAAIPTQIAAWDQSSSGISGAAEAGDLYGADLSMVDYISTSGGAARMMVAVGSPGEATGDNVAGSSMVTWSAGTGVTEYKTLYQNTDNDPSDNGDPGDGFGTEVVMVNRTPGQITGTDTLLVAAGVPGEDTDEFHDVGDAQLFSMVEDVSEGGDRVLPTLPSAAFTIADGTALGTVLHATQTHLWITAAGTEPAVYGVPWLNIVADGTAPVEIITPNTFGLNAAQTASFGGALA
jgi:hypothetical protein